MIASDRSHSTSLWPNADRLSASARQKSEKESMAEQQWPCSIKAYNKDYGGENGSCISLRRSLDGKEGRKVSQILFDSTGGGRRGQEKCEKGEGRTVRGSRKKRPD